MESSRASANALSGGAVPALGIIAPKQASVYDLMLVYSFHYSAYHYFLMQFSHCHRECD